MNPSKEVAVEKSRTISNGSLPEVVGNEAESRFRSPHDLTEDVDEKYAGRYELLHGMIRLPEPDGKGGFLPGIGKIYRGRVFEEKRDARGEIVFKPGTTVPGRAPEPIMVQTKPGAILNLSAIDAFRFLEAGVVKRVDGLKPDRLPKTAEEIFEEQVAKENEAIK